MNREMSNGATALMLAAQEGHFEIVQELLNAGVDFDKKMEGGQSAYSLALQNKHVEIASLLEVAKKNKTSLFSQKS